MFKETKAFSSFSVDDLERAKQFYGGILGLDVVERDEGLELHIAGSTPVFVYPSSNYAAPKHTKPQLPGGRHRGRRGRARREGASPSSSTTCRA